MVKNSGYEVTAIFVCQKGRPGDKNKHKKNASVNNCQRFDAFFHILLGKPLCGFSLTYVYFTMKK